MFDQDPKWFVSTVMPYMPLVVVLFATLNFWARRHRQMAPVPIKQGRKPWTS